MTNNNKRDRINWNGGSPPDSKKRQYNGDLGKLVFFGREPSKVFTEDKK